MTTSLRLAIVAGGAIGTLVRWLLAGLPRIGAFPTGTLVANVLGAFVLGALVTILGDRAAEARFTPLAAGLLGATTTFSTFVIEIVELAPDDPTVALVLCVASFGLGFGGLAFGRDVVGRRIARGAHA